MRVNEIRTGLAARLRARREELELAAQTRVQAISDPGDDPEYLEGISDAVSVALEYGIQAVEKTEDPPPAIPAELLVQARLAARHGIRLDTVIRRYLAGYTLLVDCLIEEAPKSSPKTSKALQRLFRSLASLFEGVLSVVTEEYQREASTLGHSPQRREAERIERLLSGELIEEPELAYSLDAFHLGIVAVGEDVFSALPEIASGLDCQLLTVNRGEQPAWAWLGKRERFDAKGLRTLSRRQWPRTVHVAVGEPAKGVGGWRLSHRQAKAALSVAMRRGDIFVRYRDVAVVAGIHRDDLLSSSLQDLYVIPLRVGRDKGATLRKTLRAYFASGRNVSSTAASLAVSRQTVGSRLKAIEGCLGRPLAQCASEVEIALALYDLSPSPPNPAGG